MKATKYVVFVISVPCFHCFSQPPLPSDLCKDSTGFFGSISSKCRTVCINWGICHCPPMGPGFYICIEQSGLRLLRRFKVVLLHKKRRENASFMRLEPPTFEELQNFHGLCAKYCPEFYEHPILYSRIHGTKAEYVIHIHSSNTFYITKFSIGIEIRRYWNLKIRLYLDTFKMKLWFAIQMQIATDITDTFEHLQLR